MNFEQLIQALPRCRKCADIFGFKPNPIQWGNEKVKIMIIGQAPSKTGHEITKPLYDQTGKKLRSWLQVDENTFYNKGIFYITALGHCYPGKDRNGGDKKPPSICSTLWLDKEVTLVETSLYICMGKMSSQHFFPKKDFMELVFQTQEINGKPAICLPHPSPLNIKWFKDHPEFLEYRIPEITALVQEILI